jgi:hypothetical protein
VSEKKFYVYEHWRTDRQECFYVGKGHGRRAYDMRRGRNRWHRFLQAKLSALGTAVEIKIIADGLTEEEAFAKEIERIAFWKSDGADLCNITLGGDGSTGLVHSEEWKQMISQKLKGRKMSAESRAKMAAAAMGNKKGLGKKRPQHAIDATAAFHTGRKKTLEHCAKISLGKKGQVRLHTPEEDALASARQKGIPKSESVKANMRGIPKSESHKQKLREFNLGKTHSLETREKLAAISCAQWAERKAKREAEISAVQLGFSLEEKES